MLHGAAAGGTAPDQALHAVRVGAAVAAAIPLLGAAVVLTLVRDRPSAEVQPDGEALSQRSDAR
jgi:hypothetical protein